ncbi:MAG: dolichyl-diphosphooligosaccharide-protein glycosyltransferase [archaeon GW2011_AR5]|nr:MAG: dolichyl-diphosphooligosaccharide-protein glycosyltransferase [archaeon GW2011_AR5]
MTHEIAGILATSFIILIALWITSLVWSLSDIIRTRKPIKWAVLAIVIPLLGALLYYLYAHTTEKIKRRKFKDLMKSRWTVVAIIIIMLLSMYVRLIDYRWPYLRNIDSYVFYRWMDETVINNGVLPTLDTYELAPVGFYRPPEWVYPYFYIGAYSYMAVNALTPMQLWEFLIYFPPFLATLAVIPLYFIGKMLYDRRAGVLAAFIYVFDISNLSRSLGGDPDSDAIVILVSTIVMAAMIFTYKYASESKRLDKKLLLYSVLTSVVLWVWYSTWAGYWYITWLFTGFIALKLLFTIMKKRNVKLGWHDTKYIIISFVIYTALSFALTVPSYGDTKITSALAGPIQFQSIKGEDYQFPNVYVSVAELQQSGGPREIIERTSVVGGPAILISSFFLMIYTLIYLLYSYYQKRHHVDTVLLLLVWFLGPFLATIVAIRFSTLFSAPLAIGSAIFLAKLIRMGTGEDKSWSD